MVHKFTVRPVTPEGLSASRHLGELLGLEDLVVLRDFYLETPHSLSEAEQADVARALGDQLLEVVDYALPLEIGRAVQVAHQRSTVDNESSSLITLCGLLGIDACAGKVATTYVSDDPRLIEMIRAHCFNPNIEEFHEREPLFTSLQPTGHYLQARTYDLRQATDFELIALGKADGRNLELRQMKRIRDIQVSAGSAAVTDVLLESLDARWSDHCSHSTWRSLGNLLDILIRSSKRTGNPNIVSMFHDNAGVWDFYDGWCLTLKAETHNGPSAISAYFGQLTKLGGVLRDILGTGLGSDPIGVFEYTATGQLSSPAALEGRPSPRQIARDTVRAIKEYGNTFGVPMMSSRMTFHAAYRAKPFALGGAVGLVPANFSKKGTASPGDFVVLIGGLTGNEGIHGASASSAGGAMDEAAVQIGAPLEEVKFRQAIIDLRDAGRIRAITDVGGAGLNSAVGEMGDPGGVWLNTALVPLKTLGLPTWRILLSESQERMVLAISPEDFIEARRILDRHAVRHAVIGRFTDTGRFCVVHDASIQEEDVLRWCPPRLAVSAEIGFDLPYSMLDDEPISRILEPVNCEAVIATEWPSLSSIDLGSALHSLVTDLEFADQSRANSQYDTTVQGCTYYGPYSGGTHRVPTSYWASTPIIGQPFAAVFASSFNPWLFQAHPTRAARQMLLSLLQTQVLAGVALRDICLCDNFYTPEATNDTACWLVAMVKELADLSTLFGTPFISGKDSSAGTALSNDGVVNVPPAVFLSALGKVANSKTLVPNEWQRPGGLVVQVGPRFSSAAGTIASRILSVGANDVDDVSAVQYKNYLEAMEAASSSLLQSARPISVGGLIGSLILIALSSEHGIELFEGFDDTPALFAEHRCGALIEIPQGSLDSLPAILEPRVVGRVIDEHRAIYWSGANILTPPLIREWSGAFDRELR